MHAENTLDNFWLGHCLALDKFEQTASSSQTSASSVGEKDTNPVDWVVVRSIEVMHEKEIKQCLKHCRYSI